MFTLVFTLLLVNIVLSGLTILMLFKDEKKFSEQFEMQNQQIKALERTVYEEKWRK